MMKTINQVNNSGVTVKSTIAHQGGGEKQDGAVRSENNQRRRNAEISRNLNKGSTPSSYCLVLFTWWKTSDGNLNECRTRDGPAKAPAITQTIWLESRWRCELNTLSHVKFGENKLRARSIARQHSVKSKNDHQPGWKKGATPCGLEVVVEAKKP